MTLEFSGTSTYWSNLAKMKSFVTLILDPYFEEKKGELGLPSTQKALWQIDVWSVHRSLEFRNWMSANYSYIILDFVPGGCTGLHQPCDVGIQRPFKQSIKRSYHEGIVEDMLEQIDNDLPIALVDKRLKTVCDRSVIWLWNTYNSINNKDLVKKVGEEHTLLLETEDLMAKFTGKCPR